MLAADTSALVTLATTDALELFLQEFDVHTTASVVDELRETAEHDDVHGVAAAEVLEHLDGVHVHEMDAAGLVSSRIDEGEASCAALTHEEEIEFLVTDDLRALPELQNAADSRVAISPILLKALVKREVLEEEEARRKLETMAERRGWIEAPIYTRARQLFED